MNTVKSLIATIVFLAISSATFADGVPFNRSVSVTTSNTIVIPAPTITTNIWVKNYVFPRGQYIYCYTNERTRYLMAAVGGTSTTTPPSFVVNTNQVDKNITWVPVKNERSELYIKNISPDPVFISFGTNAIVNTGIRLLTNESYSAKVPDIFAGEITGISGTASTNTLIIMER